MSFPFEYLWSKRIWDLNVDKCPRNTFFLDVDELLLTCLSCDNSRVVYPRTFRQMHRTMHNLCGRRHICINNSC